MLILLCYNYYENKNVCTYKSGGLSTLGNKRLVTGELTRGLYERNLCVSLSLFHVKHLKLKAIVVRSFKLLARLQGCYTVVYAIAKSLCAREP